MGNGAPRHQVSSSEFQLFKSTPCAVAGWLESELQLQGRDLATCGNRYLVPRLLLPCLVVGTPCTPYALRS